MGILKVKPYPPSAGEKTKDKPQEPPPKREDEPQRAAKKKPESQGENELKNLEAPDAERAILCAMLNQPLQAIPRIAERAVSSGYFANPVNATIFQSLLDMYDSGVEVNYVTFLQHLADQKKLDGVGGSPYVTDLFTAVAPAESIGWFIDIAEEKLLRRCLFGLSNTMRRAAVGITEQSGDELLSQFAGSFQRLFRHDKRSGFADAAHLLNGEKPQLPIQIVKHIVHRGSKLIVGGGSKTQKTWALMALALAVSTGAQWWGFNTSRHRVCYINLELQGWSFHERLIALASSMDVKPEEGWLKILNLRGHAQSIEQLRSHFSLLLKSGYFALVIIDPIYKVLGDRRDENKAGDVATLLNEIDKITVEADVAVAMAAHFSKGNQAAKEHMDRIGGSGVFSRDPDSILTMTQHEDQDCFTVEATLRNLPPISQFVVRWEYPQFVREEEKNPQKLRGKRGRPSDWSEQDILDQMSIVNGSALKELQEQCYQRIQMPRTTFLRHFNALRKAGTKVRSDNEGLWYRMTKSEIDSGISDNSGHSGQNTDQN